MSVATLRYEASPPAAAIVPAASLQRAHGEAELVFGRRGAETVLRHLHQRNPCRILFPDADAGEPKLAVLLTTSGGLTGGDDIRIRVAMEAGAEGVVTTQAAEKLYRSLGPNTRIAVDLSIAADSWFEYLPQETILFDNARLDRRTCVDVEKSGRFLGCEMVAFGRAAHGEAMTSGHLFDRWQVWRDGKLLWSDALLLDGDIAASLASPFQFAGATAIATAIYVGPDAEDLLPVARELAQSTEHGGASLVGGVLVARFVDRSARVVRHDLMHYLMNLRHAAGRAAVLPRIWHS